MQGQEGGGLSESLTAHLQTGWVCCVGLYSRKRSLSPQQSPCSFLTESIAAEGNRRVVPSETGAVLEGGVDPSRASPCASIFCRLLVLSVLESNVSSSFSLSICEPKLPTHLPRLYLQWAHL